MLCKICVSDQLPGNIALGMVFGARLARIIGQAAADYKKDKESPEDIACYYVGEQLHTVAHQHVFTGRGFPVASWKNADAAAKAIKEELCRLVKDGVERGVFADKGKTDNCDPCPDPPWSR
jgi:hypothetical protein